MHKLIDPQLLMLLLVTKNKGWHRIPIKHCQIMYIEITLNHQNLRTTLKGPKSELLFLKKEI